ncbi:MAG TPA: hypothetical protein VFT28_10190 [Gemmatimonadales bacterium]|nr:hypothetical protein [Gemmatimonadales bacterium]
MTRMWPALALVACTALAHPAEAQVLIRVGDPARATYSELHEGLRAGTPAADSVLRILAEKQPAVLWRRVQAALRDDAPWNDAPLALTRLAELRDRAYADSAGRLSERIEAGEVEAPAGQDPTDLLAPLRAVQLERERAVRGDAPVLNELLALIPTRQYGVGDAWVLGRLGHAASDSLQARFPAAEGAELKVRYLTLLSFSADTSAIPLLARVYAAPDSFGVPARYGSRASDALLWIGTRAAMTALLDARKQARGRGVYADPTLSRGGYDFLANDSSAVISRTGKWLTEWIAELPAQQQRVGPSP